MSGATAYTIAVQEPVPERKWLANQHYNLAVAMAVNGGSGPTFNTIFKSSFLGPTMTISWQAVYGLNYATSVPTPGAQVEITGDWQACGLGESFILDNTGTWVNDSNPVNPTPTALNVTNHYQEVSIIVGTQDPVTFEWQPIFFSDSLLPINGTGTYIPIEEVQMWFGENQTTGTCIGIQATSVEPWTMSQGNPHFFRWHLNGTWSDQTTAFGPTLLRQHARGKDNDTQATHELLQDPIVKTCTFTIGVTNSNGFIKDFKAQMNSLGWSVTVTVKSGTVYSIAGSRNALEMIGSDLTNSIVTALQACVKDGSLPAKEGWDLS